VRRILHILALAVVIFGVISQPGAVGFAQSGWDIRVNMVSTVEGADAMTVKVYFNIFDNSAGAPILNIAISSAQLTLLNTNLTSEGVLKKPDVPIYVVLVLDASGSMARSGELLKEAAKLALNNPPDDALFSVVQFDEEIKLLQDFTENLPAVSYAVDQYTVSNKGTCLYDAAYSAVEALQKAPPGRRGVILFTDGKDERRDGSQCSRHSYQELVDLAMKNQVPLHTIGLSSQDARINALELQSMAASTGGFSAIGSQADLSQSFAQIMAALKAQWMIESVIYPKKGQNPAVLTLALKDQTLTTAFTINSNTNYPGPPSPVSLRFDGLQFKPEDQTYDIQLALTSPDLVSYIKVSIWDSKAGSKTVEFVFENPTDFNTLTFPTDKLTPERDYELRIIAVSRADNVPFPIVKDDQGKPSTELVHEFGFDPAATLPTVEIKSIVQTGNDLEVTITTANRGLVTGYEGWLVDETTNTQVKESNFSSPPLNADTGTISIPLGQKDFPDGKYTVVIQVLGANNRVYATAEKQGVVYKATRPSFLQRLWSALMASPVILFSIVGIILVVILFFMLSALFARSLTGTPVTQGRLGRGLKPGKGASLPIADREPIPAKGTGKPPASGVSKMPQQKPAMSSSVPPPQAALTDSPGGATLIVPSPEIISARLELIAAGQSGFALGRIFSVREFPFTIGRQEGNLIIPDASISRRHAQIAYDQQRKSFVIIDLNSSNKTRLNGAVLSPERPTPLKVGDIIALGPNVQFRFMQE